MPCTTSIDDDACPLLTPLPAGSAIVPASRQSLRHTWQPVFERQNETTGWG
eukprot:m.214510 g.214510  ORF g.214510 m.214510 type:complete len:51 (+) comp25582_c0_seq3:1397-1549(+)